MSTVSWIVLTYNRGQRVQDSILDLQRTAGAKWDELIWIDNGSTDGLARCFEDWFRPDIAVKNKINLGVAHGYNRGLALATGDWLLITGCDRTMPRDWLKTLKEYADKVTNTGVISIYAHPIEKSPERKRGEVEIVEGLPLQKAMPMGAKMIRRDLFKKAGFLREDFGLYGWEDVEHGYRMERVAKEMGLLTYIVPGLQAVHHGDEGNNEFVGNDPHQYWRFKQEQVRDKNKTDLMAKCSKEGYLYYNPYSEDY